MDYGHTIDDWAEDSDDNYCDACEDWADDDGHGNCKDCGIKFNSIDPYISPSVAKAYSSPAPVVSASGDLYGRSSGYTWGSGGSWWQTNGATSYTSMWGSAKRTLDKEQRLLKHKSHLDSLCKVVDPTVSHHLGYSTDSSYSNMSTGHIYVDGSLLATDDDKLDIVAGLAIHEKLHLVHSQPLIRFEKKYAEENGLRSSNERLLHNIGNIIEDEYIESQLAKTHAGFVDYITKVKAHYFEKHGEKMQDTKDEFADILNTFLAFIRYPSALDAERKKRHAKHIQFFARAMVSAYTDRKTSMASMATVYEYMAQLASDIAKKNEKKDKEEGGAEKRAEDSLGKLMSEWGPERTDKLSEGDKERIRERLVRDEKSESKYRAGSALRRTIDEALKEHPTELSDYGSALGSLDKAMIKAIKDLEDSEYSEEKWDTARAMGLKQGTKVTWRNQHSDSYDKSSYDNSLSELKSSISGLRRRIQLYGGTNIYTIRNQRRGKLDKKMLHQIPLGRADLFKNTIIDEDKPLDVCLLVDESGSMGTYKMKKARETAIALREALKDNEALNLWVHGHTADGYAWEGNGETNMSVYWSPTYKSDIKAMGAMTSRCENRDGMAILASADRVKHETPSVGSNKLMIVISDGDPSAKDYRYQDGVQHTKKAVRHLEGQGWSIIQIGISGARESTMSQMFKNYIVVEDTSQLTNSVSKIIRKVIKV